MEKTFRLPSGKPFTIPDLRTFSQIADLNIKIEWVVDKLIPETAITLLHGKGGIGKTWLCLELGRCVANGEPFYGLPTKKMPVYYMDFENSLPSLSDRARALGPSTMMLWDLSLDPPPPRLDDEAWVAYKNKEFLPGLIIFDTLRSSHFSEENSSTEMSKIMAHLKEIRAKGFSIILMHHTTKNGDNFRGSMAILDLCDHVLSMERVKKVGSEQIADDDDFKRPVKLAIKDKTRFPPDFKPMYFKFREDRRPELADSPDFELLKSIQRLMVEMVNDGQRTNSNRLFEASRNRLDTKGKDTFLNLLRNGKGRLWESRPEGRETIYYPLSLE